LKEDLIDLYNESYSSLNRSEKAKQTKLIRRLKIQRQQALDDIFVLGCELADLA
jgi:hypothetical protein